MSYHYVIYRGKEAIEELIYRLYQKNVAINNIAVSLGVSPNLVRAVVCRRGFIDTRSKNNKSKYDKLRALMQAGASMEEMVYETGYAPQTIRMYKTWLMPETYKPRPPREVRELSYIENSTKTRDTWPCNRTKDRHRHCFHNRHCQCWLNYECEVVDGNRLNPQAAD